jgi:CysZ protein
LLKEIVISIQSWGEAHRFIAQHKLWKWVVIPGLIYTILFITGMYFFSKSATAVIESFTGIILWLTLLLFYFSFFKYICLIIGSPVFAYLSRKTEFIIEESNHKVGWSEIKTEIGRGIYVAVRNCGWQTIYLLGLMLLSMIPVIGWITPLIVLVVEFYYYGFSMLDYGFARNKYSSKESIRFIDKHKGLAIANGLLFYLMHLAILFAPAYAIIAATLTVHKVKDS